MSKIRVPAGSLGRSVLERSSSMLRGIVRTLRELLAAGHPREGLAERLDRLGHAERLEEVRRLTAADQARLFRAAKGTRASLQHLVPAGVPPLAEVVHHGTSNLPTLGRFQKRFARPAGGTDRLVGYNEQPLRGALGPGYFVARELPDGSVLIDYDEAPPEAPAGWPRATPNDRGLARLAFGGLRDVAWRVSAHVSVGRARKAGVWLPVWFVLCREDRP